MTNMSQDALFIVDLNKNNINNREVGNKALNLSKLIQKGFPVPDGFVIKTNAYKEFIDSNNLDEVIQKSLLKIDYDNYSSIKVCSESILNSIINCVIIIIVLFF